MKMKMLVSVIGIYSNVNTLAFIAAKDSKGNWIVSHPLNCHYDPGDAVIDLDEFFEDKHRSRGYIWKPITDEEELLMIIGGTK